MDIYLYQENIRKVKGEDVSVLVPIGMLEGFDTEEDALEALVDAEPDYLGVELVIFTQEPTYITAEEPPPTKYAFNRRNGSGAVVEEEAEPEEEPVEEEPEEAAPVAKKRPAKKAPAKRPAAKSAAKKRPAKRPASRAGTRAGGTAKRSPFTRNAASAD